MKDEMTKEVNLKSGVSVGYIYKKVNPVDEFCDTVWNWVEGWMHEQKKDDKGNKRSY